MERGLAVQGFVEQGYPRSESVLKYPAFCSFSSFLNLCLALPSSGFAAAVRFLLAYGNMAAVQLPAASNFHREDSTLREQLLPETYNWLANFFPNPIRLTGRIGRLLCPLKA